MKKEDSAPTERRQAAPAAPIPVEAAPDLLGDVPAPSARSILFRDGIAIIRFLTGQNEAKARAFVGRLLSQSDDNCPEVMRVLHEAQSMHPLAGAEAWLMAACRTRAGKRAPRQTRPKPRYSATWMDQMLAAHSGPSAPHADFDIESTAEEVTP